MRKIIKFPLEVVMAIVYKLFFYIYDGNYKHRFGEDMIEHALIVICETFGVCEDGPLF